MFARTVLAAFVVGAVAFGMVYRGEAQTPLCGSWGPWREALGVSDRHDEPTESRNVLGSAREYVLVLCPPPHVYELLVALRVQNVLRRNSGSPWRRHEPPQHGTFWGDKRRAWRDSGPVEIEPFWQRRCSYLTFGEHPHIFSRSVSTVLPLRSEVPNIVASFLVHCPELRGARCVDKSLFVSDQGFFREPYLPLRCAGQNNCENSNYDSPKKGKKSVVLVNQTQRANALRPDEIKDDEAVLIGVFGGLVGAYLTYALMKAWGDRVFSRQKERQKGDNRRSGR